MQSRMNSMISNFSYLWSPFIFKMLGSRESNFFKATSHFWHIALNFFWFHISVLLIEGDTKAKTTGFTNFAGANLQFCGRVTLVNSIFKCRFWESFLEDNWDNLSYFFRCRFSPVFIGRIQRILWRLNPSWDHLLAYLLLPLMMMRFPDEIERKLPSRFHCKSYDLSHG